MVIRALKKSVPTMEESGWGKETGWGSLGKVTLECPVSGETGLFRVVSVWKVSGQNFPV